MFSAETYTDGVINSNEFQDRLQIVAFQVMDEFEACGINEFLIVIDGALNNTPQIFSAVNSAITQIALGWENKDTSIYYAVDDIMGAVAKEDMESLGMGVGLLVSQILKYEAPGVVI